MVLGTLKLYNNKQYDVITAYTTYVIFTIVIAEADFMDRILRSSTPSQVKFLFGEPLDQNMSYCIWTLDLIRKDNLLLVF